MGHTCAFCGRLEADCPGGLWHLNFPRLRHPRDPAICRYCLRTGLRSVGIAGEIIPAEPVPIWRGRRATLLLGPPDPAA
jgi:hypothetical protein